MDITTLDLQAAVTTTETIARHAGAILLDYFQRPRQSLHKNSLIDLVTEADKASEAYIVPALHEAFPDHFIHAEEGSGFGESSDTNPFHWYVDPLDGTTNFAHRFPHFAVSLSLSDQDLHPILGVVYDPNRNECFTAIRGQGAWMNGQRLHVSEIAQLAQALPVTGFPYDSWTHPENNVARVGHFLVRTQGIRRTGSAALDLCYVAGGRFDFYWERGAKPWDVQTGILCVLEAGGQISDFQGQPSREAYAGHYILASNGLLHEQCVTVLMLGDDAPRPE
jgi:myo-inositol-1(or 4)-monophosphatase